MRAVVVSELGPPEVLQLRTLPEPEAGPGELLIRPIFVSVNFADVKARLGSYHGAGKPPFVPGLDAAGEIVAVGAGVRGFEPGQLVAAATEDGSYAEIVRAKEELTYRVPTGVDPREAAGMIVLMTAYNVLIEKGGLERGETVLVHGAAGGVGTVLLQLAKRFGAGRVIGAVGSEEKRELAGRYGADTVVMGRDGELVARLREAAPDGVDLILDPVAGEHFAAGLELLAPFGRVVVYGNAGGHGEFVTGPLHSANRAVIGYSSGHYRKNRPAGVRKAALAMLELLAAGEISVPVSRVFPLEEAAEAHRLIESRRSTGKLLLEP
jgi:NADPH2:quinone reductase